MPSGSYKGANGRRLIHDTGHLRDHRYDPSELATDTTWTAQTINAWLSSEDDGVADALSQLLIENGVASITGTLKSEK